MERDTGLSKDTLRVWERRYGFPQPLRDVNGERVYPPDQVDKLRLLKRLMDQGHRPGKIAEQSVEHLLALAEAGNARSGPPASVPEPDDALRSFLQLVTDHRVDELRRDLALLTVKLGLARFVTEVMAPLTSLVGDAWARGELAIFEEHLYTESVQAVLRNAVTTIPRAGDSPRVLLTTVPQEHHGLGVLMAEAMFALEGARCIPLGVRTPVMEIVRCADSQPIDIVALSYSPVVNPYQVVESLKELRAQLPAATELWAGGSSPVLKRRAPTGVRVLDQLDEVGPAVARWRAEHRHA
ncbi:MAG TPA: MerR family transcriptional regulator [Burkholderiaceae bacterium]|nr:MerR family transcriptional regulator [Burkholderiaceae bacterium]